MIDQTIVAADNSYYIQYCFYFVKEKGLPAVALCIILKLAVTHPFLD